MADVPQPGAITGLVLAGGRGARMGGVDKGWVAFAGHSLVEHVCARLRPQVGSMIVNANRNLARYEALGFPVVADGDIGVEPYAGPLAGMLAGLRLARTAWVACVPCDAPALPLTLVADLAHASGGQRAALAVCQGRREPVFCLIPVAATATLARFLAQGLRRPTDFLAQIGAVEQDFADPGAFANVNTLDHEAIRD